MSVSIEGIPTNPFKEASISLGCRGVLSPPLVDNFFSDLREKDLTTVSPKCAPESIKDFIQTLLTKLDPVIHAKERESLEEVLENIQPQTATPPVHLQKYPSKIQNTLIETLKTLDVKILNALQNEVTPPSFLKHVFTLTKHENKIAMTLKNYNENQIRSSFKDGVLLRVVTSLMQLGQKSRAKEVAQEIRDPIFRIQLDQILTC